MIQSFILSVGNENILTTFLPKQSGKCPLGLFDFSAAYR